MIGKMSPKDAMNNAVKGVERMLADKGYYFENKEYPDLLTGRYN